MVWDGHALYTCGASLTLWYPFVVAVNLFAWVSYGRLLRGGAALVY